MSSFNQYVVTNEIFIPKKNNIVRRAAPIRDFIAAALYPEEGESGQPSPYQGLQLSLISAPARERS